MISVLAAGGLNLVGDLLLCNVFRMGIVGAALATTAAQVRHAPYRLRVRLHQQAPAMPQILPIAWHALGH